MTMTMRVFAAALIAVLLGQPASAQQAAPPGRFDYFLLTLSWSPAYCATHRADPAARDECARHRGFVAHGLWPQNENGSWPAFCRDVPPVSAARVARELPLMPNADLIQHEWEKHGSCTTLTANAYFDALDRAFAGFHIPDRLVRPERPVAMSLAALRREIAGANPGLTEDMFGLRCGHDGRVEELRLCLDARFAPKRCGMEQEDRCPATVRFDSVTDSHK